MRYYLKGERGLPAVEAESPAEALRRWREMTEVPEVPPIIEDGGGVAHIVCSRDGQEDFFQRVEIEPGKSLCHVLSEDNKDRVDVWLDAATVVEAVELVGLTGPTQACVTLDGMKHDVFVDEEGNVQHLFDTPNDEPDAAVGVTDEGIVPPLGGIFSPSGSEEGLFYEESVARDALLSLREMWWAVYLHGQDADMFLQRCRDFFEPPLVNVGSGFGDPVAGREADQLRRNLEILSNSAESVSSEQIREALLSVDARDSIAWLRLSPDVRKVLGVAI